MSHNYADAIKAAFLEEAQDLLGELEEGLLKLEERPEDRELVGRIFRALHTIKGSGGMAGFTTVADFTHEVESLFDLVRNGQQPVERELIDIGLRAKDVIARQLGGEAEATVRGETAVLLERIAAISGAHRADSAPAAPAGARIGAQAASAEGGGSPKTYRVRFRPARDLFLHGTNPLALLAELRGLGECSVTAHTSELPALERLDPEQCYLAWDIVLTTDRGIDAVKDVFIFVMDDSEVRVEELSGMAEIESVVHYKRLGEILVDRGDIAAEKLDEVLAEKQPLGKTLVDRGLVDEEEVRAALAEQEQVKKNTEKQQSSAAAIKVRSDKLDGLVDLVGELVTMQAGLTQSAGRLADAELVAIAEKMERLTTDLRETSMSMRMVPIGNSFGRLRRLVRDLARQLGKQAELVTSGEETELDKTVIERLADPLVHLIRNAIDHGIETPEQRAAAGKPAAGTIRLASEHSGGFVYIEVSDDGAGLDRDRIVELGIERGLLAPGAQPSEREVNELIFQPGFSTARELTGVSGRGVGMDVVKTTLDDLRGELSVKSERGVGTTVTLKIPLTLAIIEGLLVKVGSDSYIFPLSAVDECVEHARDATAHVERERGKQLVNVRGSLLPYIPLRELFMIGGAHPATEQIVVTEVDGRRVGFLVDGVVGSHQTVIKNLGKVYRRVEGFSGATILGDGTMALILDLGRLVTRAEAWMAAEGRRAVEHAKG